MAGWMPLSSMPPTASQTVATLMPFWRLPARGQRDATAVSGLKPLGQHIAVARDIAFAFCYEHLLLDWRRQGVQISFFSPLADEAPDLSADAVYLPGGYPELHAERLSNASRFRDGMVSAASRRVRIYGECGGYMTLGEGLVAADGKRYGMLGLLPLVDQLCRAQAASRLSPGDALQ